MAAAVFFFLAGLTGAETRPFAPRLCRETVIVHIKYLANYLHNATIGSILPTLI